MSEKRNTLSHIHIHKIKLLKLFGDVSPKTRGNNNGMMDIIGKKKNTQKVKAPKKEKMNVRPD